MASRCEGISSYILQRSVKEPACCFPGDSATVIAGTKLLVKLEETPPPSLT